MVVKYCYDELSQLIRENNKEQNKTITYEYDGGGNLLNKKEYDYTEQEITIQPTKIIEYIYNNANWKDQLTSYDGKEISYDAVGNIISYNGNEYTWQNGRELSTLVNNDKNLNISYKYNDDGIRTEKTVNGKTTKYYLDGNIVIFEDRNGDKLFYQYDENNNLIGFTYNDEQYYYIRNGQNDIIGILNKEFKKVASYSYDSCGNLISVKDENNNDVTTNNKHIGNINEYRYKGYRYDSETELYYLNNRYYDSEIGRFINEDSFMATGNNMLQHNMYMYCNNNPIIYMDREGEAFSIATFIGTIVIAALIVYTLPQITQNLQKNFSVISSVNNKKQTITKTNTKTSTNKKNTKTKIYRWGNPTPHNLTPKRNKDEDGLSFSLLPPTVKSIETTIEDVNATGILYATIDKPGHVSVKPTKATMEEWMRAGEGSIWTTTLRKLTIRWTPWG